MKKKIRVGVPDKLVFMDIVVILAGCVLYAVSISLFSAPNNIAPGGIVGISTVVNYLLPFLPIGMLTFVFNIPVFIWGWIELGWKYVSRSVITVALSSVLIDVLALDFIAGFLKPYQGDAMLVSIFGGILSGAGLALIFWRGSSTGGTDIVSRIMHEKMPHVSMGNFIMIVDVCVITFSAVVYKNIDRALYALIFIFVSTRVIDMVLYGMSRNNGKLLFIVTAEYDKVSGEILTKIDRGVTLLNAEGGFKRDDKRVIMCALRPQQVHKATALIKKVDPEAFIIITTANAIKGRGFPAYDEEGGEKVYIPQSDGQNTDINEN